MKLHANAALSLTQRRRMVSRVLEQGWTITAAAAAADDQRQNLCGSGWLATGLPERAVCWIAAARHRRGRSDRRAADRSDRARCAGCRFTGAGDRRAARACRSRRCRGSSTQDRDGPTRPARARAGRALRTRTAGRADPPRRQKARTHPGRRRAPDDRPPPLQPATARCRRRATLHGRLRLRAHRPSTTARAWPTPRSYPTRSASTASGFLRRAITFYRRHGITVERVIDRQRPGLAAPRSTPLACRALGVRHLRTRPRRPQTNGKAERFIRTMLAGWAYGALYGTNRRTHRSP